MARVYKCKCRATGEDGMSDVFIKIDGHYYKSQEVYDEHCNKLSQIKSGIYKITNTENNKVYIGESLDIYRRWDEHKYDLLHNKHCNYLLQNDFNKYGIDIFGFEIIQEHKADGVIPTKCQLLILEYKYIRKFEKENYQLYNIEYSLLKALNGDKPIFQSGGFDSFKAQSILVSQSRKYKFNLHNNTFVLSERNTPLVVFRMLSNNSSCTKKSVKYKNFMDVLYNDYKADLDKIIKTYKFKYKLKTNREEMIEEVTEYGMEIFKKILEDNTYLKNGNNKYKSNNSSNASISSFIYEIRNNLKYDIDTYSSIKQWLCNLGLISIEYNHMYITDISENNNFLIRKSKCYDKVNKVDYFTITTTKEFRGHINNLIEGMSDSDKLETFYNPVIESNNNIKL